MPTNKPNIEVPNHTDRIDEILKLVLEGGINILRIHTPKEPQLSLDEAKAQIRNYISEEIKAVIGANDKTEKSSDNPNAIHWLNAEVRDVLRDEQLMTARNRGHNV